ncbi:hypothetical protein XENOCAPTIV_030685, partial [Xenoophorus captivus]
GVHVLQQPRNPRRPRARRWVVFLWQDCASPAASFRFSRWYSASAAVLVSHKASPGVRHLLGRSVPCESADGQCACPSSLD